MALRGDRDAMAAIRCEDGEVLASDVTVARGPFSRALGLMFRRSIGDEEAVVLDAGRLTTVRLHMLFVPFDLDVVFLDEDRDVVAVQRLAAWRGRGSETARYAVELPAGAAESVEPGERLTFVEP